MNQKERNKKITSLAFGEGKTYKEIGKMFNISPQRAYDIAKREMARGTRTLRAWAVLYKSSLGVGGIEFRTVADNGEQVMYPRIFLTETAAREYGKNRSDFNNFRVVPVNINY